MPDAEDNVFLLPGPVRMHPRVLRAMSVPALNHRGPEFKEILRELRELVQYLFGTHGEVAILSGSGTAGLESVVTGLLRKDDQVLNLVNGKFSERFSELCAVFSSPVPHAVAWGKPIDADIVTAALEDHPDVRAVSLCWNETSTGLTNPLPEIAKVVRKRDKLFLVDGITAVGGLENRFEEWGIDALVVGSQKCVAAPAGISAVALSNRAYESLHTDTSFYSNLKAHIDGLREQDTPYTPAVPLFLAFREALRMLREEGLENRIARTKRLAEAARAAYAAIDVDLFPDSRFASNTVTATSYPRGIEDSKFRKILREEHRVILAGGQAQLKGRIFRIGHMGICTLEDLVAGFVGIEATLASLGHRFERGAGVAEIASRA